MTANFSTSQLTILAIGSHIDIIAVIKKLELLYPVQRFRDALHIARYLELKPRIELLNLKLKTIHDLFDMLAAEQNHQHSSFLEWIIIILIAIEIVLFFVH